MKKDINFYWKKYSIKKTNNVRNILISHYLFLVEMIAKKVSTKINKNVTYDELYSSGVNGLIDAINKFSPELNIKFETFSPSRIWGSMIDQIRSDDWIPRSVRDREKKIDCLISKNKDKYLDDLLQENDISPIDYHANYKKFHSVSVASVDALVSDEGENKSDFNDALICKKFKDPISFLTQKDFWKKIVDSKDLTSDEKKIIFLLYYKKNKTKNICIKLKINQNRFKKMKVELNGKLKRICQENLHQKI